jgi:hypothetical protein
MQAEDPPPNRSFVAKDVGPGSREAMILERPAVNRLPAGMKALQEHVNK